MVIDLLKQIITFVFSHFYTLLIEVADAWYQNQLDAVTVIGNIIQSRSSSYSDFERSVRETTFASETENWRNRKEVVERELWRLGLNEQDGTNDAAVVWFPRRWAKAVHAF